MKAVNISFEGAEAQKIACESGMKFVFDASVGEAEFTRDGNDLVISKGGVAIVLTSFYDVYNKDEQPSFEIDGVDIASADFFQAMNATDLQPAAGPGGQSAASAAAGGGRYSAYSDMALLDGINKLGPLDIGFNGEPPIHEYLASAGTPDPAPVDPTPDPAPVDPTPDPAPDPINLIVLLDAGENMSYSLESNVKLPLAGSAIIDLLQRTFTDNPDTTVNLYIVPFANRAYMPGTSSYLWGIGKNGNGVWEGITMNDVLPRDSNDEYIPFNDILTVDPETKKPTFEESIFHTYTMKPGETLAEQLLRFAYMHDNHVKPGDTGAVVGNVSIKNTSNDAWDEWEATVQDDKLFMAKWLHYQAKEIQKSNIDPAFSIIETENCYNYSGSSPQELICNNYQNAFDVATALIEKLENTDLGENRVVAFGGFMDNGVNVAADSLFVTNQKFRVKFNVEDIINRSKTHSLEDDLFSYTLDGNTLKLSSGASATINIKDQTVDLPVTASDLMNLKIYDRAIVHIGSDDFIVVYHADAVYLYRKVGVVQEGVETSLGSEEFVYKDAIWGRKTNPANTKEELGRNYDNRYVVMKGQIKNQGSINAYDDITDVWASSGSALQRLYDVADDFSFVGFFEKNDDHGAALYSYVDYLVSNDYLDGHDIISFIDYGSGINSLNPVNKNGDQIPIKYDVDKMLDGKDWGSIIHDTLFPNDSILEDGSIRWMHGSVNDDTLNGGNFHDIIFGGSGKDKLYGNNGNDYIHGGKDNDELYGGENNDKLYGGTGDDILYGEKGDDFFDGGTGYDIVFGDIGNDIVVYDSDDLKIDGGDGIDFLLGATSSDLTSDNVSHVEVAISGTDATSLTDMQIMEEHGIATNGKELYLDKGSWTRDETTGEYNNGSGLSLSITSDTTVTECDSAQFVEIIKNIGG